MQVDPNSLSMQLNKFKFYMNRLLQINYFLHVVLLRKKYVKVSSILNINNKFNLMKHVLNNCLYKLNLILQFAYYWSTIIIEFNFNFNLNFTYCRLFIIIQFLSIRLLPIIIEFIKSFNHLFIQSFNHLFNQSFNHSITYSFNHSITYSINHLFIPSLIHSITYSFRHLFVQ